MDTYNAPLAQPGLPAGNGIFATSADRTKAANSQFAGVAKDYGWLPQGTKARYFLGITDEELGQNASAETELKAAAGAWDRNLANLAKVALAGLYHQTSRDQQAIDLYNEMVAKPSETVSAPVAQLDLADLYVAEGKQAEARTLWAKVKDADKDGPPAPSPRKSWLPSSLERQTRSTRGAVGSASGRIKTYVEDVARNRRASRRQTGGR